jgi:hypothetical protein
MIQPFHNDSMPAIRILSSSTGMTTEPCSRDGLDSQRCSVFGLRDTPGPETLVEKTLRDVAEDQSELQKLRKPPTVTLWVSAALWTIWLI